MDYIDILAEKAKNASKNNSADENKESQQSKYKSRAQIKNKLDLQVKKFETMCENISKRDISNDVKYFLDYIKPQLEQYIKKGISFPQISKMIDRCFYKKVSHNTIKKYCVDNKLYKQTPRDKKIQTNADANINAIDSNVVDNKTNH